MRLSVEFYGEWQKVATELPSDLVAQLVRAWQAICQVAGLSPSQSHCLLSSLYFLVLFHAFLTLTRLRSDSQVWSMLNI